METKELKIEAPKGYEIDKDHSTFECIKFKPIKKDITYEDVCNNIFKTCYYTDGRGRITYITEIPNDYKIDKNNATNKRQLEKLLALNQLLNIAEYYNNLHGSNVANVIKYDNIKQTYVVVDACIMYTRGIRAIFNRMEDAQAVIDNPNFREILDTIYKD